MPNKADFERAMVLGAGVMGAQIAALLANAGLQVDLVDMADEKGGASRASRGVDAVQRGRSPALYDPELARRIRPGTFAEAERLEDADWVIEAVVEDTDIKKQLYRQISPRLKEDAVFSSNTSGLSVNELAAALGEEVRSRFLGVHFFNPPRMMRLVEIVPAASSAPQAIARVRSFIEEELGKGAVLCRDTPNFIANRLGVFALMDVLHRMGDWPAERVDALTGPLLGRPKSATLRLADIIGLDTLAHVAQTSYDNAPKDPWRSVYTLPLDLEVMLADGRLGSKSGGGFYRKGEAGIESYQACSKTYLSTGKVDLGELSDVGRLRSLPERLRALWKVAGAEADFARAHLTALLYYAAYHAPDLADSVEEIDRAMRWGFNWQAGPFELWDAIGIESVTAAGKNAGLDLPEWMDDAIKQDRFEGFYRQSAPYKPGMKDYGAERAHEIPWWTCVEDAFEQVEGAYAVRQESLGVVVLRGKLNVLGQETLDLLQGVLQNGGLSGLVLTGAGGHFSAGADLKYMAALVAEKKWDELEAFVLAFQQTAMAIRTAAVPVVAAAGGLVLGGGSEFCLAAAGRVWAAESRPGLVESQVGLLPGGGGCKEMLRRLGPEVDRAFGMLVGGTILDNAYQGRRHDLVMGEDPILMNESRVVPEAIRRVSALAPGYQPPNIDTLAVGGEATRQRLLGFLECREGLSEHDKLVGEAIAGVLSGGGGPARTVGEWHVLDLEREAFLRLCATPKTQERVAYMLKNGKPLKN